ncbi:aldehyde dehydrogenase family protein [Jiulongibacter sediminis]|uniref:aldehyde dehydrogenase family protein n=1 Tax=Jiulongibacter sediminis TaxID=1605367 RepID=UPI0026F00850|nr:aldehyde dehydrogenase family protein [Jiulongibacter sediminis]
MPSNNPDFNSVFEKQKAKSLELRSSKASERISKIKALKSWIENNQTVIAEALYRDFRKSETEVKISEIMPVISEARFIVKNLKAWMAPKSVSVPLLFLGTSNKLLAQPKGNALIISPWNYPLLLALKPLMAAIAAGCTAIIKPSELTPNTSDLLHRMIEELFPEDEVCVFTGGAETAIALQKLPFNHVFFTGSPAVGKLVMKAASEHLASVTLELGGKSPCVVDSGVNLKAAAKKIAFGKFLNAGQTCIAPDYILVKEDLKEPFIQTLKDAFENLSKTEYQNNNDFCRIINEKHFERIDSLIDKSVQEGASIVYGSEKEQSDCFIPPTILTDINLNMPLMEEEIFGPVLPVLTYENFDEAINLINQGEKPLAIYMFGGSSATKKALEQKTSSGPIVHNDFGIQFIYHGVPFGGINNSGIGVSGGYEGFLEFSHLKPVIKNHFNPSSIFYPPYTPKVKKLLNFAMKYLA